MQCEKVICTSNEIKAAAQRQSGANNFAKGEARYKLSRSVGVGLKEQIKVRNKGLTRVSAKVDAFHILSG